MNSKILKEITTINYGKSPKNILSYDGIFPVIGTGETERKGNKYLYDGESIILPRKGTIDKIIYVNGKFWTIDTAFYLSNFRNVNVKWLYYFLQQINFRDLNEATGVPSLSREILYKIKIIYPPKPEQSLIAEILSTADRAIEQTEAVIAKLQRIKTGLMQDLLTKGIDEQGNIRSEKMHRFKDSPLGRIPVEWEVVSWKECAERIQDGTHFSPKTDSSELMKYITSRNIKFGYIDLTDVEYIDEKQHKNIYKRCPVKKGDVLLTKDGANTGNAAINSLNEEFSLLSSVAFIRTNQKKLLPDFLLHFILSIEGQRLIKDAMSGLAIKRITLEIINNFLIKLPHVNEQKRIVSVLNEIDNVIKNENYKLKKLTLLKTALMQDLLTGRVRVTELLKKREKVVAQ